MLSYFDFFRQLELLSVTARLGVAMVCGGLIGLEREFRRRSAGFRTHILICVGAAMTTLVSQYLLLKMHYNTDVARLGAQVIAGIGFIGAGTIIVTRRQRVKGLTTAAGLWVAAIIGLACGAGYVECAIFATLLILFAELVLIKFEHMINRGVKEVNLYVEYGHPDGIEEVLRLVKSRRFKVTGLEITRVSPEGGQPHYCAVLGVQGSKETLDKDVIGDITALEDVMNIEEL